MCCVLSVKICMCQVFCHVYDNHFYCTQLRDYTLALLGLFALKGIFYLHKKVRLSQVAKLRTCPNMALPIERDVNPNFDLRQRKIFNHDLLSGSVI